MTDSTRYSDDFTRQHGRPQSVQFMRQASLIREESWDEPSGHSLKRLTEYWLPCDEDMATQTKVSYVIGDDPVEDALCQVRKLLQDEMLSLGVPELDDIELQQIMRGSQAASLPDPFWDLLKYCEKRCVITTGRSRWYQVVTIFVELVTNSRYILTRK